MNKFFTLAAIAIVVAGFAYYALFWDQGSLPATTTDTGKATAEQTEPSATATSSEREPFSGTGSLRELQARGEALECSITYTDATTESDVSGTYFVANDKLRGDFLTDSPDLNGQILTSMIIDGETMYTWTEIEGEQYGMQVALAAIETGDVDANEPVPLDADVEFTCTPWPDVDNTIFLPPSDVIFRDMTDLMQGGMEYGTIYDSGEMPTMPPSGTE